MRRCRRGSPPTRRGSRSTCGSRPRSARPARRRRLGAGPPGSGATTEEFDRLVIANGVFCEPAVPTFPGLEEFTAAGGRLCAGTEFHDAEGARGMNVLVVGYGKSACDVTVPISEVAASTTVIARQMLWKVPRKIAGVVNFKMLLLTRMGEALFRYLRLRGLGAVPARAGQRGAPAAAQRRRHGVGAPVPAARAGAGARRGRWRTSSAAPSAWRPRASSRVWRTVASTCGGTARSPGCSRATAVRSPS